MFKTPEGSDGSLSDRLAEANQLSPRSIVQELRPAIERGIAKHRRLSQDFRVAMTNLCWAELSGGEDGEICIHTIINWLNGTNNRVSAVRPYQIFNRITRTNARYLFESMLHWLRLAGYPGLLLIIDTRTPHYYQEPA